MRRLDILTIGKSRALNELAQMLTEHGHTLKELNKQTAGSADLIIEDGSLPLSERHLKAIAGVPLLHLRVHLGSLSTHGLPGLRVSGWLGQGTARQLLTLLPVTDEPGGNGQGLCQRAIALLLELAALHVSCFSRDAGYFLHAQVITEEEDHGQSLDALEPLAYLHRYNRTADPSLLLQAQVPIIERLQDSLSTLGHHPALVFANQTLSYAQLHAQSLAIQRELLPLLKRHPASEQPLVVGIGLPKCAALYAGVLAILGTGAVYLPLDPEHPLHRQQYILENAGAALLLHDGKHPLSEQWPSLDITTCDAAQALPDQPLMQYRPESDAPCMALYTSGTTGRPKGVLLSQGNLGHFTSWYASHVQLSAQSRVLQLSTLSFDSSVLDIFATLIQGATLIIPEVDQRRDPAQLLELIHAERVSHAFLPPALLSILPLDQPLPLTHVMTGGDLCEPWVIERLASQCHLHNLYGPTEATVLATVHAFRPQDSNRLLGAPIANTQVLILDAAQQPVAENTVGELYIVGPGVCLGYLNAPGQTTENYLTLNLPDGQRLRAYRTGDLGQWTDEGILLGGRRDHQVKIRGFRVEPEEIERCLRDSRLFRQVSVVINAQRRILAFVAQPLSGAPDIATLKHHAEQQLPDYMQPAAYTLLPVMPFTGNGKVDRTALLELPLSLIENVHYQAPMSVEEAQLQTLWSELLELPVSELSTDESFFNLGGHSILLSVMLLRIRQQFGRSISINRFIESPTLTTLATLVGGVTSVDVISPRIECDARRELGLNVLPPERLGDVRKIIVTGANSFVGVHIVQALLDAGAHEVACLVRDTPACPAGERFTQALEEYQLRDLDLGRVRVYPCDMTRPRLGLTDQVYERLDTEFGVLVHNAAHVNHVMDYPALAAENVEPIFECLRLCEGRNKKIFNLISTLSAVSDVALDGQVLETPAASTPPIYIKNGYNLSKWVAERLLQRASELGVWTNLYRPGNISFNSQTGVCQPHKNRLLLMLKGSLQLGQVPDLALSFDLMPVDFLAWFIAFHAGRHEPGQQVFNLHNPQPLSWHAYTSAFRDSGHVFATVSVAQWQQQLHRVDRHNALFGVLGFYLNGFEEDIGDISRINHDNAQKGVQRMGTVYPQKTTALLRKGCEYLKAIDFI